MITKEQLLKIREYISCPQFGDKTYGIWGALRMEQREAYLQLIEEVEFLRDKIKIQQAENERYLHSNKLHEKDVAQAKSEAYREFWDKLKNRRNNSSELYISVNVGDRLLKELTEAENNG